MQNFKHNSYVIEVGDLIPTNFPYSKILQGKYNGSLHAMAYFKSKVEQYLKSLRHTPFDMLNLEEITREILLIKEDTRDKYPLALPEKGYYDLKVWREQEGNEKVNQKHIDRIKKRKQEAIDRENRWAAHREKLQKERNDRRDLLLTIVRENFTDIEFTYQDVKVFDKKVTAIELAELLCDELDIRKIGSKRVLRLKGNGKDGI